MSSLWDLAKQHDIPNWFALAFTVVLWPLALFWWQRRRINNVPNLEVIFKLGGMQVGNAAGPAINITFLNHTGSVVYITSARIKNCSSAFSVPNNHADRDSAENSYHLKFQLNGTGNFEYREITLQTNQSATTSIAVTTQPNDNFFSYVVPWYRRWFNYRKFFILEYTAMVGNTRYLVATLY